MQAQILRICVAAFFFIYLCPSIYLFHDVPACLHPLLSALVSISPNRYRVTGNTTWAAEVTMETWKPYLKNIPLFSPGMRHKDIKSLHA